LLYYRRNDTSIYDELTIQDAELIGDVDFGADITGTNACWVLVIN